MTASLFGDDFGFAPPVAVLAPALQASAESRAEEATLKPLTTLTTLKDLEALKSLPSLKPFGFDDAASHQALFDEKFNEVFDDMPLVGRKSGQPNWTAQKAERAEKAEKAKEAQRAEKDQENPPAAFQHGAIMDAVGTPTGWEDAGMGIGIGNWRYDPLGAFNGWVSSRAANGGRGFSPESQKVYASMWGKFARFCVDEGDTPAQASEWVIASFLRRLSQERLSRASTARGTQAARSQDVGGQDRLARRYLSMLSRTHRMLMLLGIREDNPAAHMLEQAAPEPMRPDPSPLRQGGGQRLRSALVRKKAADGFDWRALRDDAIVELLVGSGMTSRQLRQLTDDPHNLSLSDSPAWVVPVPARRGQGRPGRLPLSREAAHALQAWLAFRRERIPGVVLFPATLGGDNMSAASLYRAVASTLTLAQDDESRPAAAHLGPRTLRHTFAIRQLRAGKPIDVVQQWLNHRNSSSTEVYQRLIQDPMGHEPV